MTTSPPRPPFSACPFAHRAEGDTLSNTQRIRTELVAFVKDPAFPCLGAKAAFNTNRATVATFDTLGDASHIPELAYALSEFLEDSRHTPPKKLKTFVACFKGPQALDEEDFERLMWQELQALRAFDAPHHPWCPSVSDDPASPHFAYSFEQEPFFLVGLHPQASRHARRFSTPAIAFNLLSQFNSLKENGRWERMKGRIRQRDVALQGFPNPELQDHGQASQARQYSGRQHHDPDWTPPFDPYP